MCETPNETPNETQDETQKDGKATITYDDFCKLDMRIATIVEVAEHPNADRLTVMKVDLGDEKRQIIAGIKKYYTPEALLGKQVVVVTNLAPRKMRGMESNGMLLAASVLEGDELRDVVVLTTDGDKQTPPGAPVS